MTDTKSVLIVGVGGQGIILAGKIFTQGLMQLGYDVKMSEIHGMSQRGGSVSAHIRYGSKVYAPVIGEGEADILLSFEEMETYRWLSYLKPTGKVILNTYQMPSAPILAGQAEYPSGIREEISAKVDTVFINAMDIALGLGMPKSMNIVLFGALVKEAGLAGADWPEIIKGLVPPKFLESNLKAFAAGMQITAE